MNLARAWLLVPCLSIVVACAEESVATDTPTSGVGAAGAATHTGGAAGKAAAGTAGGGAAGNGGAATAGTSGGAGSAGAGAAGKAGGAQGGGNGGTSSAGSAGAPPGGNAGAAGKGGGAGGAAGAGTAGKGGASTGGGAGSGGAGGAGNGSVGGGGAAGNGSAGAGPGGSGGASAGGGGSAGAAGSGSAGGGGSASIASCDAKRFVDEIPAAAWVELQVKPSGGMSGLRQAIRSASDQHPSEPVRIHVAPGFYADDLGAELFIQHVFRSASAPIWIVADDPSPNATRLGHGLNFVGVSYFAIEGLTIGPPTVGAWNGSAHADPQPLSAQAGLHVAGAAIDGGKSAKKGGALDTSVYGKYQPSHHLVARRLTIQNVFSPDAQSAVTDEGQSMDGIKLNQVTDVWVEDSTVVGTSRHGMDNVGVHRAAFCGNTIAHTGGGLGIEAKGGSIDVLYERNVFFDVRRVELGGEATDATYYFSSDGLYSYEARRTIARDNLIVDAREAALEFSGCLDCAAVGNTVLFSSAYVIPGGSNATGGDAIRIHDSVLLGVADGAGSDCVSWSDAQQDYVSFDPCWGVGSSAPAPVGRVLPTKGARVVDNVFASAKGTWKNPGGASTIPCPLNLTGGTPASELSLDGNHWWNGGKVIASDATGCVVLPEGPKSVYSVSVPTVDPKLTALGVSAVPISGLRASAAAALRPTPGSALVGAAVPDADGSPVDFFGVTRPTPRSIGAIEP